MTGGMSRPDRDDLVRGPKWRTRTTARRRHLAAAATVFVIVVIGWSITWAAIWCLERTGAPLWVTTAPWWLPTVVVLGWSMLRPTPAAVTDDDDDTWPGYSIRWAMVGEIEPRRRSVRAVLAIGIGAPVGWLVIAVGILTITGLL